MLTLHIIGPMRLIDEDGASYLPLGKKAQAVLALLAAGVEHRRARNWLQDKLWSDRGPKQGAASLRQSLTEIRKALGPYRDAVATTNGIVSLDARMIRVSSDPPETTLGTVELEPLHGLDVRDPEFEDWVRDFRVSFTRRAAPPAGSVPVQIAGPEPVLMLANDPGAKGLESWFGDEFGASIARALTDLGAIKHIGEGTAPGGPAHGLILSTRNHREDGVWHAMLRLKSLRDEQVVWSGTRSIKLTGGLPLEELETQELGQQAVVEILLWVARQTGQSGASVLTAKALRQIFSLNAEGLLQAEHLLSTAYEMEPRAVILAWKAFLRLTQIVEFHHSNAETLENEARDLITQAYRDAPNNAVVQAIAAQVRLLVDRDAKGALYFSKRGIDLDGANPLAWGYYALAMAHLGRQDKAHLSAKRARYLARSSPFVFWWDMLCCLTSLSAGHLNEATSFAENVRAVMPQYRPALRYLYPLYRAQSKMGSAGDVLADLIRAEPGFKLSNYQDDTYPVATLRKTPLVEVLNRL